MPTAAVFAALERAENPAMPDDVPAWRDAAAAAHWLSRQRNDLERPAVALAPSIGEAIDALAASAGCLLARMSGSGATAFGMFAGSASAEEAAQAIAADRPDWWVRATGLFRGDAGQDSRATT